MFINPNHLQKRKPIEIHMTSKYYDRYIKNELLRIYKGVPIVIDDNIEGDFKVIYKKE